MELLQFFAYAHLPEKLRPISKPFSEIALALAEHPDPRSITDEQKEDRFILVDAFEKQMRVLLPDNVQANLAFQKLGQAGDAVCERYHTAEILELLLEAKDCAVRSVLFKQGDFTIDAQGVAVQVL